MSEVPLYSSFVSRTGFHGERKLPVLWVGYSARDSDVSGNSMFGHVTALEGMQ